MLILGGSSYVGRCLFHTIGNEKAIATYNRTFLKHGVFFDSMTMELTEIIDNPEEISHAIILLGDTDPETCAKDVQYSRALNVVSIKKILDQLGNWKIKPIFTSSEFVFDGKKGKYHEADQATPILLYGQQKLEIEQYIQKYFEQYVILRLAKVYGDQLGDGTLFTGWLESIEPGKVVKCASDQTFSPIFVNDVIRVLVRFTSIYNDGLFHLSGPRAFTRIALLEMLLVEMEKYGISKVPVEGCSIHDFNLRETRPEDVSMIPTKLIETTGVELTSPETICRNIVSDWCSSNKILNSSEN